MTDFYNKPFGPVHVSHFGRPSYFFAPWRMCITRAHKGGWPLLRSEPKRVRDINGIGVFLPRRNVWITFRRHG